MAAFPAQQIYSFQQLAQAVEGKIAYVDGDNDLRGSQQGIESQQAEIGRTVDDYKIVVISQAGKCRSQTVFPSFLSCKLLLRRAENDFGRNEIQVIGNGLRDLLNFNSLAFRWTEDIVDADLKIRPGPKKSDGAVSLWVQVYEQYPLFFLRQAS